MKFFHASGDRPLDGYTIKRGIGAGGFGEVYFAISDAGKEVAIKRVQRNLDVELRGVRQCLNLKHPHLLALYDIRHDDSGQTWIVMEYMAGDNLQQVIEHYPQGLPPDQVRHWLTGIALGVEALHEQGIVHRDLKPGNVFMDCGFVKIGDYGLSKFISCSRRSGHTESVGTFHYMAPEIGRGCYGKEIDIYALGILIYEMLTGRVPFDGESSQEIIMKHLTSQPDLRNLPAPYSAVVARCLSKDPQQRPQSVSEIIAALDLRPPVAGVHAQAAYATRSPATEEPILAAELVSDELPEEPLWKMAKGALSEITWRWKQAQLPWLLQLAVFGILFVFATFLVRAFPLLIGVWMCYLGYYVAWRLSVVRRTPVVVHAGGVPPRKRDPVATPRPVVAQPVMPQQVPYATAAPPPHPPRKPLTPTKVDWQAFARQQIRTSRSTIHAATSLTGSLMMATLVSAVVSVLGILIASEGLASASTHWGAAYAWIFMTTLIGSWGMLVISKPWDGFADDPALKRFIQLVVGLVVGFVAFGLSDWLLYRPDYLVDIPRDFRHSLPSALYNSDGYPTLYGFLGHFAGLFALVRWWRFADPLRHHRLALLPTAMVCAAATLWHFCLPMPMGVLVAGGVALTVQLSAPWVHNDSRDALRRQAQQAAHVTISV